jgi:hypothetical protein
MLYVDMLLWNTGMFEATLEGISARPVAECTAVQVADALTRAFALGNRHRAGQESVGRETDHNLWDLG